MLDDEVAAKILGLLKGRKGIRTGNGRGRGGRGGGGGGGVHGAVIGWGAVHGLMF